uniref:Ubiquitinyl hydrolase 1 n=1 Tax=Globodera pallida TaxID=36090 RepID=A0A183C4S3_GLOPA
MLSLVRFILIDVIHGRPYLLALLLRDKLDRIYLAHLNKKKEELQDAFNDVTRIFLLRGPVDLVDIGNEYGDEHGLYIQLLKWLRDPIEKEVASGDEEEQNVEKDESTNRVLIQAEAKEAFRNDNEPTSVCKQPVDEGLRLVVTNNGWVKTMNEVGQQFYGGNADGYGNPAFAYSSDQQQQNMFMPNQAGMQDYTMQPPQADFEQFQLGSFNKSHTNARAPPLYPQLDYDPNQELINYSDITNQMSDMSFRPQ